MNGGVADNGPFASCPPNSAVTEAAPHHDAAGWDRLIEGIDPASLLLVVESWLGQHLNRHAGADDVLQEALLMAWRDREQHRWQDLRRFRAWVLQIARNRVLDLAKHAGRQKRAAKVIGEVLTSSGCPGR